MSLFADLFVVQELVADFSWPRSADVDKFDLNCLQVLSESESFEKSRTGDDKPSPDRLKSMGAVPIMSYMSEVSFDKLFNVWSHLTRLFQIVFNLFHLFYFNYSWHK